MSTGSPSRCAVPSIRALWEEYVSNTSVGSENQKPPERNSAHIGQRKNRTRGTFLRRTLRFLTATTLATASLGAAPAQAAAPPKPVVFVHGRNADPGVWNTMRAEFARNGYPEDRLFAWSYDTSKSTNEVLSGQLQTYVHAVPDRTGAPTTPRTRPATPAPSRTPATNSTDRTRPQVAGAGREHGAAPAGTARHHLRSQGIRRVQRVLGRQRPQRRAPGSA
ncbi:hypothetical protein ACIGW8_32840 [Streptomyces sioyaensis]|uniref:hypothetical protein n=1 Tax=Streptomyces sioyaensis TaxID=67364 RepID=UPI0037CE11F9